MHHVLFLCTGNSARSLLAEAILSELGSSRFQAHSAGSHPKPAPHPLTLETLERLGYPTAGLRSKSWHEFTRPDAPAIDIVLTVCDAAASEVCPVWPGAPITAHWGVEDPAAYVGTRAAQAARFEHVHDALRRRIEALVALDPGALGRDAMARSLRAIGRRDPSTTGV